MEYQDENIPKLQWLRFINQNDYFELEVDNKFFNEDTETEKFLIAIFVTDDVTQFANMVELTIQIELDLPVPEEEEPPETYADGTVILPEDLEEEDEEEEEEAIIIEDIVIELEETPVSAGVEKIEEVRPPGKEVVDEAVFKDAWRQFAVEME